MRIGILDAVAACTLQTTDQLTEIHQRSHRVIAVFHRRTAALLCTFLQTVLRVVIFHVCSAVLFRLRCGVILIERNNIGTIQVI